ncbi:MAG TPA: tannase/feruloyl esterase family alpha/beta hydrolase [Roseiarcus sp.]
MSEGARDTRFARKAVLAAAVSVAALGCAAPAFAASCEGLVSLKLPDTTIETAQSIPAGDYTGSDKVTRKGVPAFCRVTATVKDAPDSAIRIEMWLPKEGWTGVFHGNGNGGYAGVIAYDYGAMEAGLKRGYATAITDMGTAPATPLDGDALVGHPQKWKDWGILSTHVMAVVGKDIAKAFYGVEPKRAYYTGCSTGGQQGIVEAQYYPEDFDGVLVGDPVVNRTWGHLVAVTDYAAANLKPGHKLSDAKLALLTKSAVAACGARNNGLKSDPFIADPTGCNFDPSVLICKGAAADACLTPEEAETAAAFYAGPTDPTGKPIFYGWPPGSEAGGFNWAFIEAPGNAPGEPAFDGLFKWVFGADWKWRDFDLERDMPKVDAKLGAILNGATTGDLSKFRERGGKMIIYQGWADPIVPPLQTVAFYKAISAKFGGDQAAQGFARLFLVPGFGHCFGGAGPNRFDSAAFGGLGPPSTDAGHDAFTALAHWVEDGAAPPQIVATKFVGDDPAKGVAMQRPLCPYPQKAWYKGGGDPDIAANFTCAVEGK